MVDSASQSEKAMLRQAQWPLSALAWATGGRTAAGPGVWDRRTEFQAAWAGALTPARVPGAWGALRLEESRSWSSKELGQAGNGSCSAPPRMPWSPPEGPFTRSPCRQHTECPPPLPASKLLLLAPLPSALGMKSHLVGVVLTSTNLGLLSFVPPAVITGRGTAQGSWASSIAS
jgi:hypothetical protein